MTFTVSNPPALNRTYKVARNKQTGKAIFYKDAKAQKWMYDAILEVRSQKVQPLPEGHYSVAYTVHGLSVRQDIDSVIKALSDLLQNAGVIANDKLINEMHVYRGAKREKVTDIVVTLLEK